MMLWNTRHKQMLAAFVTGLAVFIAGAAQTATAAGVNYEDWAVTFETRKPIKVTSVTIYPELTPKRYEVLSVMRMPYADFGNLMERFLQHSAEIGANGLYIRGISQDAILGYALHVEK